MEEKKKEFMEDLKKNLKKKADGVSISEEELDRIRHKYNMPISAIKDVVTRSMHNMKITHKKILVTRLKMILKSRQIKNQILLSSTNMSLQKYHLMQMELRLSELFKVGSMTHLEIDWSLPQESTP
ncbi:unnamed protein product [Cylindrotheca closterium]|uniref:Uncharacterized protein n=1 Tax=Cylindrotheca closterium TaxID=2856 RepID=A0AAD2PY92_9STRA|nr:unnamed protein product [Cylindrotheca closterium]